MSIKDCSCQVGRNHLGKSSTVLDRVLIVALNSCSWTQVGRDIKSTSNATPATEFLLQGIRDGAHLAPSSLTDDIQYLYVEEILFVIAITLIKFSILVLYTHIFNVRRFRQCTWIIGSICGLWCLFGIFFLVFQCRPIRAAWHFELQQTPGASNCFSIAKIIFGFEISNVLIDVSILILPVYMGLQLQMKLAKKISIICIFLLGGL